MRMMRMTTCIAHRGVRAGARDLRASAPQAAARSHCRIGVDGSFGSAAAFFQSSMAYMVANATRVSPSWVHQ